MPKNFDIVIVGAGALGISCAYELIKSGHKVALFDQFKPPHRYGSSHGGTRLFRQAYFEDERYIPFLKDAYKLWQEWQEELKCQLLYENGYLTIFHSSSSISRKMRHNAQKWNISGEEYNPQELSKRFPQFTNDEYFCGYLEKQAGMLDVTTIFKKSLEYVDTNAKILNEKVLHWNREDLSYKIVSSKREYSCAKIIICCGAWLTQMPLVCKMPLTVKRGVQFWYKPPSSFCCDKMPCFAFTTENDYVFGFPPFANQGIKIASYHPRGSVYDLEAPRTSYTKDEFHDVHDIAVKFLPWLKKPDDFHVCMYTLTTDEDFILDYVTDDHNILILGGGSGHAFKFMPFLGKQVTKFFPENKSIPDELRFFRLR